MELGLKILIVIIVHDTLAWLIMDLIVAKKKKNERSSSKSIKEKEESKHE